MRPTAPTTRGRRSVPIAILLLIAVTPSSARAEEPALPTPPRQAEPWSPPRTSLPRFLVSATATLCEQGLADPRGCEYRSIRFVTGSVWGGQAHDGATNGWALPAADGGKPRYGIAWSGLVYPLTGVGGPADLDADLRALAGAVGDLGSGAAPKGQPARRTVFNADFRGPENC